MTEQEKKEQELKEILDKVKETANETTLNAMKAINDELTLVKESVGKVEVDKDQLKTLETSIKELKDMQGSDQNISAAIKALEDKNTEIEGILLKHGDIMRKKDNEKASSNNVKEQIRSKLEEKADDLTLFKTRDNKSHGLVFEVKGTVTRSDISGDTTAMRIPGVARAQRRVPYLRELFTPGTVSANSHGNIRYTDQTTDTNGATSIAEGGAYPTTSDIAWIERTLPIEKIGDSIKVSRESMKDIDFIEGEINNFLLRNMALKADTDLLSGTGVSPILKGMATSATAFAAGDYANSIEDAEYYDLITVIAAQISTGTNFVATEVLMHPSDAVKMKLDKDADGNYIIAPFVTSVNGEPLSVDGVRVITNSGVTANTMYVGDFTRGTVYSEDIIQIEMGYENDDFTKDLVTIKARERMALLIRIIDNGAFVKVSDITAAIAAINLA